MILKLNKKKRALKRLRKEAAFWEQQCNYYGVYQDQYAELRMRSKCLATLKAIRKIEKLPKKK